MSRRIVWFDTVGSTMTEAARLAASGAPSGTAVGANRQTAGQGRLGRYWESQEGGLYVSVILRLPLKAPDLPVLTLALGLATAEAIQNTAGVACDLRWPNDVLLKGRKVAGILSQLHGEAVITGIGVNLGQSSFPDELSATATSVLLACGTAPDRDTVLEQLLDAIDRYASMLVEDGKDKILAMFTASSSYVLGRRVVVESAGMHEEGTTDGLDESGFLWLRTNTGQRKLILAGGVRPAN